MSEFLEYLEKKKKHFSKNKLKKDKNIRTFLIKLGEEEGFQKNEDWYKISS